MTATWCGHGLKMNTRSTRVARQTYVARRGALVPSATAILIGDLSDPENYERIWMAHCIATWVASKAVAGVDKLVNGYRPEPRHWLFRPHFPDRTLWLGRED